MRLKECRKRKKLTAKQLGDIVGVAGCTISLYESGKREPDLQTLCKLADALNVTADELLGRVPKSTPVQDQRAALESLVHELVKKELDQQRGKTVIIVIFQERRFLCSPII